MRKIEQRKCIVHTIRTNRLKAFKCHIGQLVEVVHHRYQNHHNQAKGTLRPRITRILYSHLKITINLCIDKVMKVFNVLWMLRASIVNRVNFNLNRRNTKHRRCCERWARLLEIGNQSTQLLNRSLGRNQGGCPSIEATKCCMRRVS